jgi:hypothetical protein
VRGGDGHFYVLKHFRPDGRWELASFTRRESNGTSVASGGPLVLH